MKFPAKQCIILLIGAFFGFAPFWAKHVQTVAGRGLFVTPDAMVLLGVTLLFSLLAYYLLPDFAFGRPASTYEVKFGGSKVKPRRLTWVKVLAVVFSLWAIVYGLYLVNQRILHSFLSSADEHSCYFLAECLRRGKLYVDIPPFADFFQVVHVGMKGGKWFSVYPPGWPLIWAIGLNLNIVDWLNPVMSALAIFFFYLSGKRLFGLWSTVVGLWLCVLSPFFMFTAASYFSHATCLLCISIFLYAFLRWREARERALCHPRNLLSGIQSLDSRFRGNDRPAQADTTMTKRGSSEKSEIFWASLCAFAVGYGLMTRYLTMAAVAGPFLLYHYLPLFFDWRGWGRGPWRLPVSFKVPRLRKSDWVMIGVIAVFMAVILWQNYLVTGKPFKAPNKYDKSWERLGFRSNYTPVDAFFYLVARVFYLMDWFAPAIVAAYLVLLTKIKSFILRAKPEESQNEILPSRLAVARQQRGQDDKIRSLFILTPVFIAVAYFFYYSWGGNQWGPRYWWEGLPFLSIAVTDGLARLWRDGETRTKKFIAAFLIASIAASGILFAKHAEFTEEASRQRRALYDLAERTIQGPAIVFISGFLGDRLVLAEEDAVRNSPFLDGRILYAHDLRDRNKELMAAYPGHSYYRGTYDRARLRPQLERLG